jgi:preprotein translocase subunit SecB
MADTPNEAAADEGEAQATNGSGAKDGEAPSMRILAQYLKDFSFENPAAPESLMNHNAQPQIDISVNVNAKALAKTDFEVELQLEAKASDKDAVVFAVEILYAGIFRLENIPEEQLHALVLIECPRMLFPFARHILADATRNGGFPPLMIDPIDFNAMYRQRIAQEKASA